jgi:dihydrofolate reductase
MTTDKTIPHVRAVWAEAVTPSGDAIVIGRDGGLPWPRQSEDLRRFREATRDRVLIMGSRTFESLPAVLKTRRSTEERPIVVLTSRFHELHEQARGVMVQGIPWVDDTEDAEAFLRALHVWFPGKDVAVVGGPSVIELFWPLTDEAWITLIAGAYEGDTRAPFTGQVEEGLVSLAALGKTIDQRITDQATYVTLAPKKENTK